MTREPASPRDAFAPDPQQKGIAATKASSETQEGEPTNESFRTKNMKIKTSTTTIPTVFLFGALSAFLTASPSIVSATLVPKPIPPAEFNRPAVAEYVTGVVRATDLRGWIGTGSGAVVNHPKVLLTCAHVVYEAGAWLPTGNIRFTPHHHDWREPNNSIGLRTYYRFDSYSSAVRRYNNSSKYAYTNDIVAGVAYQNLADGYSVGHFNTGAGTVLTSRNYTKKTLGYPKEASRNFFMYRMIFNGSFARTYGAYYNISGATTFGGNSGGPILGYSAAQRNWFVAGVVVSSNRRNNFGVRALDGDSNRMLAMARNLANQ